MGASALQWLVFALSGDQPPVTNYDLHTPYALALTTPPSDVGVKAKRRLIAKALHVVLRLGMQVF